jgi:hypothetical protein
MAATWLIEECRQQAVLFLAAAACLHRKAASVHRAFPEPLVAPGAVLQDRLRARAADIAGSGSLTGLDVTVSEWFQDLDDASLGVPAEPWTYAEVARWWLGAGAQLVGLDTHQRSVLARITGGGSGGLHPAVWCAERFGRLKLSAEAFDKEAGRQAWNERASNPLKYRFRLFRWVVSPDRERPDGPHRDKQTRDWLAAVQAEMRDIRQDLEALFGPHSGLRVGGKLTLQTSDRWIAIWTAGRLGEQLINELRGPVIQATDRGDVPRIRGVAVLPPAQTLCAELVARARWPEVAGDRSGMLRRATEFAAARWQPGELVSAVWSKAVSRAVVPLPIQKIEPAFLAVARWITTARLVADPDRAQADDVGELIGAMQVALALEGFQLRESRGGRPAERIIPTAVDGPARGMHLVLAREASAFEASLGCVGDAASCGPALFAAIEALDWRLWAFRAAPWDPEDQVIRKVVEIVRAQVARSEDWESVKQQALHSTGAGSDTEALGRLFRHAHDKRLAHELLRDRVYIDKPADAMLSGLIGEYRTLAMESLAALVAIDPAAAEQLDPPRRGDGEIEVAAWLGRRAVVSGHKGKYQARWIRSGLPRGEVVEEKRTGSGIEIAVVISAGQTDEADLSLLNAPPLPADGADGSRQRLGELLATFRQRLAFSWDEAAPADSAHPLEVLRGAFSGDEAAAFHDLLERCRGGDDAAATWCRLLREDARFRFACHPGLDLETGALAEPQINDPYLSWEYDAVTPQGKDIAITFALEPAGARRVISRGSRHPGSPSVCAEELALACRGVSSEFARLAQAAELATDRWQTFGPEAEHPIGAAEKLLDYLLEDKAANAAQRTAIFEAAARWCGALGHEVLPAAWRPEGRLLPQTFAGLELQPDYDAESPTGTVVVRRFGLRGVHGRPFSGAVSAGPCPAGFLDFRAAVQACLDASDGGSYHSFGEVLRGTDELPKHSLAGTLSLALPNLFDQVWVAFAATPAGEAGVPVEAVAKPFFEMLKAACRMVPFEPRAIAEYSAGWVKESDGSQPRGRRIRRLVRPGIRTVENVLVRPALVITE